MSKFVLGGHSKYLARFPRQGRRRQMTTATTYEDDDDYDENDVATTTMPKNLENLMRKSFKTTRKRPNSDPKMIRKQGENGVKTL